MKIDIKGVKGFFIRWVLPTLIFWLKGKVGKMSSVARKKLVSSIKSFAIECKKTPNDTDDEMAAILKELLGII